MIDAQYIIQKIRETFADVKLGEAASIHQAQLADQSLGRKISPQEFEDARRLDPETRWQDVPARTLDECDAALSHLCPIGWKFYIPAFMVRAVALAHTEEFLPDDVIFHLTYKESYNISDPHRRFLANRYILNRFDTLDEKQVETVITFFKFMTINHNSVGSEKYREHDTAIALKGYWSLPKPERPDGKA